MLHRQMLVLDPVQHEEERNDDGDEEDIEVHVVLIKEGLCIDAVVVKLGVGDLGRAFAGEVETS